MVSVPVVVSSSSPPLGACCPQVSDAGRRQGRAHADKQNRRTKENSERMDELEAGKAAARAIADVRDTKSCERLLNPREMIMALNFV